MKMTSLNCPKCGAPLTTESDRAFFFCQNCGSKILLQNENEYIYRHVDEARLKQAETDRIIRLKQLDMQEKQREQLAVRNKKRAIVAIALAAIGVIMMLLHVSAGLIPLLIAGAVWLTGRKQDEITAARLAGKVQVPNVFTEIEKKNYREVEVAFRNAGFTNITCIQRKDLALGVICKPESVATVSLNGTEITSGGSW